MKKIIDYFIENTFVVNLVAAFIILLGVVVLSMMKRDLHPPFEFQSVRVNVSLSGATPIEMEKFVTFPIEESLEGLLGVEEITSQSTNGLSRINLYYQSSHKNMQEAAEKVRSRIESIRYKLPQGIRAIEVERNATRDIFLYFLGIEGFSNLNESHRVFLKKLEKKLSQISGIVRSSNGMRRRDIYIQFHKDKLRDYEISMTQARKAILGHLSFTPIGQVSNIDEQYSVEIEKTESTLEKISLIPITGNRVGNSLTIGDIATVNYKLAKADSYMFMNGKDAVYLSLRKDTTTDTILLKNKVLETIESLKGETPEGLKIVSIVDGPQFIERQLNVLQKNGLLGLIFVFLALMLFLNIKTAVMTTIGLPVAYFGTLLVLYAFGISIDLISLIGMILVIGILVDDAIIVAEKYTENLERGLPPKKAASEAVSSLIVPVTGTVLTTMVAFSPIILIKSEMSHILFAVPVVVISALCLSWLESFFILPNHLVHFVKKPSATKVQTYFEKCKGFYKRMLSQFIKVRYLAILGLLLTFGGAIYLVSNKIKQNFELRVSAERLSIYAVLKESSGLDATREAIKPLEDYLRGLPAEKVENIYTSVGRVWMTGKVHNGYNYAKINVYLDRNSKKPTSLKKEMLPKIEEFLKDYKYKDQFEKLSLRSEKEGNDESKARMVSVLIRGNEDVDFSSIEDEVVKKASELTLIKDYVPNPDRYQKIWKFLPDKGNLVKYKLSPAEVAQQIRGVFTPDEIVETRLAGEKIFIYTELFKEKDLDFNELDSHEVVGPNGVSIPLKFLGQWEETKNLKTISHRKGMRNLTMDFEINKDGNIEASTKQLKLALEPLKKSYPSYDIKVIEADEQGKKNKTWALKVAAFCILSVLFVMALILKSLTQPFIVGLPIPFGVIGVILSLYFHGLPLGLMALIGLVGVVGVSVNASIVMVDQINRLVRENGFSREIVIDGAASRLRAIVLTTITTLCGVFPMAYALGGESGFTQPLAFSMAWGLSFATVLTLFVLPSLLIISDDIFSFGRKILTKYRKEPAILSNNIPGDFFEVDNQTEKKQREIIDRPLDRGL